MYAAPLVAAVFVCAYVVMFSFINKRNIKLEPFSIRLILFSWVIELPFKYSDAYRSEFGRTGPGLKLYLSAVALFFTTWLCLAGLMLLNAING